MESVPHVIFVPLFDPRLTTFHLPTVILTKNFFLFIIDHVFIYSESLHLHLCVRVLMILCHYHFSLSIHATGEVCHKMIQMKMHKCVNKVDSSYTLQEAVLGNRKKGWRVY